jgi:DNA-dependent RNA polymerase auxiliary subunit epsilon
MHFHLHQIGGKKLKSTLKEKNGQDKFYAYKTIREKYGTDFAKRIKLLLEDPEWNMEYVSQLSQQHFLMKEGHRQWG